MTLPEQSSTATASARADTRADAVAELERAAAALRRAQLACATASGERDAALVAAARAGVSVRQLAELAGIGKTQASEIARYGEAGWR